MGAISQKKGKILKNLEESIQNLKISWKRAVDCVRFLNAIHCWNRSWLVTELVKHGISWTFKQTSVSLYIYVNEPTIRSIGFNFVLSKLLLSLRALQNLAMSPGVKMFLVSWSIYIICMCLLNSCPIDLNLEWNVINKGTPLDSWFVLLSRRHTTLKQRSVLTGYSPSLHKKWSFPLRISSVNVIFFKVIFDIWKTSVSDYIRKNV